MSQAAQIITIILLSLILPQMAIIAYLIRALCRARKENELLSHRLRTIDALVRLSGFRKGGES